MDEGAPMLQPADGNLSYAETLLEKNDLPAQDVRSTPDSFYIGYSNGNPIGVGGLEIYESAGLVRSLVVEQTARGNGFGTAIYERLEAKARASGVVTLYLLTTTVPEFFASQGYTEIERSEAPTAIQQTTEFTDLCPTTAICMKKSL